MGFPLFDLITAVPALVSGAFGTVNNITNAIANEKLAVITATTQRDQIAAQERVRTLETRRDLMIAESSKSTLNIRMRAAIAAGPTGVLLKIFLWDKVVGSLAGCSAAPKGTCGIFTTDTLDPHLWQVIMVVLGFYFLCETFKPSR